MKVKILSVSLNPDKYDISKLAYLSFDNMKKFIENDTVNCLSYRCFEVDQTEESEMQFHADGVRRGDGSDTMLNWLKVEND